MTKFKLFFSALCILLITTVAQANPVPEKTNQLRFEIADLIQKLDFGAALDQEEVIHLNFTVNSKNEIIVLSTSNERLDRRIKLELNYKKVKTQDIEKNKIFTLPVRVKATS